MVAFLPIPGGHIKLAERFVNPAFSFAMGWNYWYNWTIILPAELSAAAVLIDFWNHDTKLNSGTYSLSIFESGGLSSNSLDINLSSRRCRH